jgi:hypothetical protein
MWTSNKDPTLNNSDVSVNSERSVKIAKHRMVKQWKRDHSANVNTGQFVKTANRYTPLTERYNDNIGTIPVVVNGSIATKHNAKVKYRNTSCRSNGGIGEKKQNKKKSY